MAWKNVQYENGKLRTSEGGSGGASNFADLNDVNFSNLQNGQVPKYNSNTHKWENADESGGSGTVTDVKVDGQSVVDPQTGEANITMPTPPTIPVEDVEVNGVSVVNAQKVAQIKSYKEVTQAEYESLPASKLSDDILYCIKDSAGADSFPPLIYSDEEREIGVWRDGKPLYQKTIKYNGSVSSNTWHTVIDDSDINENISSVEGFWILTNGSRVPLSFFRNTTSYTCYNSGSDGLSILQYGLTVNGYVVTIQYTKTTDTPGSGTWTTQGAIAHHYSTDEHIIGTWIDGEPLYERTIDAGSDIEISNSSWISTGITVNNVSTIINCFGTANDNSFQGTTLAYISNNVLQCQTPRHSGSAWIRWFVLQYTKTTD